MRALPEHAPAAVALAEIVERFRDSRGEFPPNLRFCDVLQDAIAGHAPGERPNGAGEVEAVYDLDKLREAVGLAKPIPMRHGAALQQSPIAREQRAMLCGRDACELRVIEAIAVKGVETEHAHVRGQLAEVD